MERCSLVQGRRAVSALLLVACLLGSASAHFTGAGRRAPAAVQAQLRASPAGPPAAANATEATADVNQQRTVVAAFRALADVSEEQQQQRGNEGEEEESGRPVTLQVPEQELKEFVGKLSPKCKAQFTDILGGKSEMHNFGQGGNRSKGACADMKGSICSMNAQVTQQQEAGGRKLKSVTQVTGKSCLPQDCMADEDLKVLASFMKVKARETLGTSHGLDIDIGLRVDCSASGGSSTGALSTVGDKAPAEARQPNENTVENNMIRPTPMHSAASARVVLGTGVVVMLGAAASATIAA